MKECIVLFVTVGIIMSIGLVCMNEACKAYTPAPSTEEYLADLASHQ